jgi:hypothetical protein
MGAFRKSTGLPMTSRLIASVQRGVLLGILLMPLALLTTWWSLDAQRWHEFTTGTEAHLYLSTPRWQAPYVAWQLRHAQWTRRTIDVPSTGERISIDNAAINGRTVVFTLVSDTP